MPHILPEYSPNFTFSDHSPKKNIKGGVKTAPFKNLLVLFLYVVVDKQSNLFLKVMYHDRTWIRIPGLDIYVFNIFKNDIPMWNKIKVKIIIKLKLKYLVYHMIAYMKYNNPTL